MTDSKVASGIVDIVLRKDNQGDTQKASQWPRGGVQRDPPSNSRIKQDCQ